MRRAGRPRSTPREKILETFATRGGEKPDEWILAGFSKPLSLYPSLCARSMVKKPWMEDQRAEGEGE